MAEEKAQEKKAQEEVKIEAVQTEAPKEVAPKGNAKMPKQTESKKPTDCKACGKALRKKLWHYRNGDYFCNDGCFKKKLAEDKKKAEPEKNK